VINRILPDKLRRVYDLSKELIFLIKDSNMLLDDGSWYEDSYISSCSEELTKAMELLSELEDIFNEHQYPSSSL